MYYTQQKLLRLTHKVEQQKPKTIDGYDYKFPVPPKLISDYREAISAHSMRYLPIVHSFHAIYGEPPFNYSKFLDFLRDRMGFTVTIYGFSKDSILEMGLDVTHETKGTWCWDNEEKSEFSVWVNTDYPTSAQNVTIIHEAMHALQDYDYAFHDILKEYPLPIQLRIAERIAEKTAIAVVLPNVMLEADKRHGLRPHQIALKYGVSLQMAGYA